MEAKLQTLFGPDGAEENRGAVQLLRLWTRLSLHFPIPVASLKPDYFMNFEHKRADLKSTLDLLNDGSFFLDFISIRLRTLRNLQQL